MIASVVLAMQVPGLELHLDYLEGAQQERLISTIDALPWLNDLRRRVQHFGYRYDYRSRAVQRDAYLGPLPYWAAEIAEKLARDTPLKRLPDQLIVNEYLPGQGISPHVDCIPCFGDVVVSISLGSSCAINFSEPKTGADADLYVPAGSLVVMSRDARYVWRHSIAPRKSDLVDGRRVRRGRRISLTFRTVILDERS